MKFKPLAIILTLLILSLARAAFADDYTITLIAEPIIGGTVTGAGDYKSGKNATITAAPAQGYTFVGWFRPGETTPFTTSGQFTYDQEKSRTYIAKFEKEVTVGAIAEPAAAGTVKQSGSGSYPLGGEVTLIAQANDGFAFLGWYDASSPIEPVHRESLFTFKAAQPVSYIAKFAARYNLDVNISPEGAGTVTGAGEYTGGSIVMVEATPGDDYRFLGWAFPSQPDNIINTDAKYAFNLDSNLTLTAKFGRSFGYVFSRILLILLAVAAIVAAAFFVLRHFHIIKRRRMRNGDPPFRTSERRNKHDI